MNTTKLPFSPLTPQVFHILLAIAHTSQHGYHIREQIAYDTNGLLRLADGTVYQALKRLKQQGWIEGLGQRPRRYHLTPQGEDQLQGELQRLKHTISMAERRLLVRQYRFTERPAV